MNKLRIVCVDYYLAKPVPGLDELYAEFRGEQIKRVPIVRIFGVTDEGEKACLHVHGVYPYFCIPIDSMIPNGINFTEKESLHMKKLMRELDTKIHEENQQQILQQQQQQQQHQQQSNDAINSPPSKKYKANRSDQIIHKIVPFDAYKMYGYNEELSHFYKICLYNPSHVSKASALFSSGFIECFTGKVQSYQTHVPFILQFFIDYNLYGMNFIHLKKSYSRYADSFCEPLYDATQRTSLSSPRLKKMTTCSLEFDCKVCDIAIQPGTGTDLIWEEEKERCNQMDKSFNLAPSFSQQRPNTENQVFKREGDFLSIIDRICGLSDDSFSEKISQNSIGKSNTQLESDFNRICLELMQENQLECETSIQNISTQSINPLQGPSHLSQISSSQKQQQQQQYNSIHPSGFKNESGCSDEEWDDEIDDNDFLEMVQSIGELVPSTKPKLQPQELEQEEVDGRQLLEAIEEEMYGEEKESNNNNDDLNAIDIDDLQWAVEPDEELLKMLNESMNNNNNNDKEGNGDDIPQYDGGYESSSIKSIKKNTCLKGRKIEEEDEQKEDEEEEKEKDEHEDEVIDRRVTRRQNAILLGENVTSKNGRIEVKKYKEERKKYLPGLDCDVSDEGRKKSIPLTTTSTTRTRSTIRKASTSVSTCIEVEEEKRRKSERIAASKVTYDTSSSNNINDFNNHTTAAVSSSSSSSSTSGPSKKNIYSKTKSTAKVETNETVTTVKQRIRKVINGIAVLVPLELTKEQLDQIASASTVTLDPCPSQSTCNLVSESSQQKNLQKKPYQTHHLNFTGHSTSLNKACSTVKMVKEGKKTNINTSTSRLNSGQVDSTTLPFNHRSVIVPSVPNATSYEAEDRVKKIDSLLPLTELRGKEKVTFLFNLVPQGGPHNKNDRKKHLSFDSMPVVSSNDVTKNVSVRSKSKKFTQPTESSSSQCEANPLTPSKRKSKRLEEKTANKSGDTITLQQLNWDQGNLANDLFMSQTDLVNINEDHGDPAHRFVAGPFDEVSHVTRLSNLDEIELYSCYAYDSTIKSSQELEDICSNHLNEKCTCNTKLQSSNQPVVILDNINTNNNEINNDNNLHCNKISSSSSKRTHLVEGTLSKMRRLIKEENKNINELGNLSDDDDDEIESNNHTSSPSSCNIVNNNNNHRRHVSLPLHSTPTTLSKRSLRANLPTESPILSLNITQSPLNAIPENSEAISPRKFYVLTINELDKGLLPYMLSKKSPSPTPYKQRRLSQSSILSGPTLNSQEEFGHTANSGKNNVILNVSSPHEFQFVSLMSVEVFAESRGSLLPDPAVDSIRAIFYSIHVDDPSTNGTSNSITTGILITKPFTDDFASAFLNQSQKLPFSSSSQPQSSNGTTDDSSSTLDLGPFSYVNESVKLTMANDEMDLLFKLIDVIRNINPDFLVGFEVEKSSWGYIVSRASYLNIRIATSISRLIEESDFKQACNTREYKSEYDGSHISAYSLLQFPGRILLDIWNIMRNEVTLDIYTFENCYYHILHKRIPKFTNETLFKWYNLAINVNYCTLNNKPTVAASSSSSSSHEIGHAPMWRVFEYFITRCEGNLKLLLELNFIGKHSTLARVYGIQFSDNISRGSQYRVESIMLRLAKTVNMIPVSITPKERSEMKAVEWIPFVMEPESSYYSDPVVVLDFQALYPSMMIAYNYCFTTCLGRVSSLSTSVNENNGKGKPFEFGASTLTVPLDVLKKYRKSLRISPNGVAFVKENIRRGIVPEMLDVIIRTRMMVKNAMKENMSSNGPKSKSLQKILDSRQLALKMIANTTYGYIGATISGRMPCVEIADAIVSKGKEALKRAIDMVHSNSKWNARVVYGDTDSLFILLPGRSKSDAFKIGNEIANAVTDDNPQPVKLKFEKVYHPCVLQTKKRYVGYSYESIDQVTPKFDAKGIETVRRDQIPATSKLLEKSLRLLFESNDMSVVKNYLCRQFSKMDAGSLGLVQDFIFAKEYRGREFYSSTSKVPSNELVKKSLEIDRRSEPRRRHRVPYVIISGSHDQPLYELVRNPLELIKNPSLKLNIPYYLERVIIPALNRVYSLLGQDVAQWRNEMPKKKGFKSATFGHTSKKKTSGPPNQATLSQYFLLSNCPVCFGRSELPQTLCNECQKQPQLTSARLIDKIKKSERTDTHSWKRCLECSKNPNVDIDTCISLECENLFRRSRANAYSINRDLYHKLLQSF